jgi:hypothetical protein
MDTRPDTAQVISRKDWLSMLPFYAFFLLLSVLTLNLPFFWDKDILYSRIAHWLLTNEFSTLLPDNLDPGYPPALAYLLAGAWKVFGITLPVMHLLMLPFTLGIIWQTRLLLQQFLKGRALYPAMVLILADTTLLAQTVVFSTDLVMLFFMLLALNSLLHNRRWLLSLALTGLLFSHMRGVMIAVTIGLFDLYRFGEWKKPVSIIKKLPPYLPGFALFAGWMLFHYHTKGWIGYHAESPWAGCYELVNGAGFLKNCAIVLWRLADFGHVFIWLAVAILLVPRLNKQTPPDENLNSILMLLLVSLLVTLPVMLIYKMLNGHRYLIPVYYFLSLLTAYMLFGIPGRPGLRKILAIIALAGLLSGNFWIYPDRVAKGWDSTLAHLPYHHLRHKMMQYIERNHIPVEETGSKTPNTSIIDYIELNGDHRAFLEADLTLDHYVFYSNVFNMFTDEEITRLKREWLVEKEYRCLQVRVTLYRNPGWQGKK